ncbi:MAG TPA: PEGA domain-containing protein [Ignavibacteria bacterium]
MKSLAQSEDSLIIDYNYINSIPQNADIYLNNEFIGKTPMHFRWGMAQQSRVIKIKLEGYADMVYTPSENEEYVNKTFKLVSLTGRSIKKETVFKDKSFSFQKRLKIVPIIISTAITVTSAIMAYYFKSLAIDKNEEFESSGDPALLDQKKKYDVIGGVSLAVFQIGLGALLYYHFIDN